jgi:hypothetical protein
VVRRMLAVPVEAPVLSVATLADSATAETLAARSAADDIGIRFIEQLRILEQHVGRPPALSVEGRHSRHAVEARMASY